MIWFLFINQASYDEISHTEFDVNQWKRTNYN